MGGTVRPVSGFLGFQSGSHELDVVLIHREVRAEHADNLAARQAVDRQVNESGVELAAAVDVLGTIEPTLADRSTNECQSAAAALADGDPIKRPAVLLTTASADVAQSTRR